MHAAKEATLHEISKCNRGGARAERAEWVSRELLATPKALVKVVACSSHCSVKRDLFLFNGYFGRLNYRKDIIALFEVRLTEPVVIIDVAFPAAV